MVQIWIAIEINIKVHPEHKRSNAVKLKFYLQKIKRVYRIYYINKRRLWIAVIPFRHAYFTEWMARYKKLLTVIPQISIRFPPTDYNAFRQEDQDRMRFPIMCN